MPRPKSNIRISIVGPGNVGTALALGLKRRGHSIVSIIGRSVVSARRCAKLVSCKRYSDRCADIDPRTNLLLIATPDSVVDSVAHDVARSAPLRHNQLSAFHVSGVLTSDALRPLTKRGALCFSLHPIQTFTQRRSPEVLATVLRGISYGFEGNSRAEKIARRIVQDLRGTLQIVPKEQKILYHIACVFASNYLLTVIEAAETIGTKLRWKAPRSFGPLIEQTITNARRSRSADVLTGPIARGDVETVRAHIGQLRKRFPELLPIYRELGLRTVEIANRKERRPRKDLQTIRSILKRCA